MTDYFIKKIQLIEIPTLNGTVIAVTASEVFERGLNISLMLVTIVWSIWRWRHEYLKNKKPTKT